MSSSRPRVSRELIEACASSHPDCAFIGADEAAPPAIAGLRAAHPGLRVVLVVDAADADLGREALRAGATGFVNRSTLAEQAPEVARAVTAGTVALPPLVAASLLDAAWEPDVGVRPLSEPERVVIGELAAGRSYRAAATAAGVDAEEAKVMVAGAVDRLQAASTAGRTHRP